MIDQLIFVSLGISMGTIAGLLPGVGVLSSLILVYPFIYQADILHLLLFYIALAGTVQFTGTIPSILLGVPGENNSIPAVIEGRKFVRHGRPDLAIGICALGSVFGSAIAVFIFLILNKYALQSFALTASNNVKFVLFLGVLVFMLILYNNKNIIKNLTLLLMGLFFGLVGESNVQNLYRFTLGIDDLKQGLAILPVISGLLIIPIILKSTKQTSNHHHFFVFQLIAPASLFFRNIASTIRGSLLGIVGGLVPGVSTVLATNLSHNFEKFTNKNKPAGRLIAAETANNSGQFASLIPLLLLGIPITGSEILLFNMMTANGWSVNIADVSTNTQNLIQQLLPWFVFTNLIALCISWPLAKYSSIIFSVPNWLLSLILVCIIITVNIYVGFQDYRLISYIVQLVCFSMVGLMLSKWEIIPLLFTFLLASEIEAVFYRGFILHEIF